MPVFRTLLERAMASIGPIFGVLDWYRRSPVQGILLRHDVDRRPMNAVALAELENSLGVRCTYYFRVIGDAFCPRAIERIAQLGHEIGYHYEDLAHARGNPVLAMELFTKHLSLLGKYAEIRTIAMHGSPLSRFNNHDLWITQGYRNLGIEADALLDIDYTNLSYFTDTGRSWGAGASNLRDRPPSGSATEERVRSTMELAAFLHRCDHKRVAITAHPERWDSDLSGWLGQLIKDAMANTAKIALRLARTQ